MILASLTPALLAFAIFFGSLRPRRPDLRFPTKFERQAVAASARSLRKLAGVPLLCVGLLLVAPLTIGALHLFCDRDEAFVTGELR